MPISQERMIALTAAALDYQQACVSINNYAQKLTQDIRQGVIDPLTAFNLLATFTDPKGLLGSDQTNTTIALESRHWRQNAKRNIAERQRQRKRRGTLLALGESAHTSPHSLSHGAATHAPANILRREGLSAGLGDYMQPSVPQAVAEVKPRQLIEAGAGLSPEVIAKLEREADEALAKDIKVKAESVPTIPPMSGDMAQDIADDMDDPLIPQANDGHDS